MPSRVVRPLFGRFAVDKLDPSGHFHIWSEMGNASPGSEHTRLEFSDDDEDYK